MKSPEQLSHEELVEVVRELRDLFYLDAESKVFDPTLDVSDVDLVACVRWRLELSGLAPERLLEAG